MSRINTNTFTTLAANGQSAAFELPGDVNDLDVYVSDAAATWGGGTLILQTSFDGGTTWVAVPSASYTAGSGLIDSARRSFGKYVRLSLSGATSPSLGITVKAKAVSESDHQYLNITANGNSTVVLPRGGALAVFVKGTFDSASLTLAHSPDGTLYVDSGVTAITAAGGGFFANGGKDTLFRIVTASIVTAADLDVWVYSVPA